MHAAERKKSKAPPEISPRLFFFFEKIYHILEILTKFALEIYPEIHLAISQILSKIRYEIPPYICL